MSQGVYISNQGSHLFLLSISPQNHPYTQEYMNPILRKSIITIYIIFFAFGAQDCDAEPKKPKHCPKHLHKKQKNAHRDHDRSEFFERRTDGVEREIGESGCERAKLRKR